MFRAQRRGTITSRKNLDLVRQNTTKNKCLSRLRNKASTVVNILGYLTNPNPAVTDTGISWTSRLEASDNTKTPTHEYLNKFYDQVNTQYPDSIPAPRKHKTVKLLGISQKKFNSNLSTIKTNLQKRGKWEEFNKEMIQTLKTNTTFGSKAKKLYANFIISELKLATTLKDKLELTDSAVKLECSRYSTLNPELKEKNILDNSVKSKFGNAEIATLLFECCSSPDETTNEELKEYLAKNSDKVGFSKALEVLNLKRPETNPDEISINPNTEGEKEATLKYIDYHETRSALLLELELELYLEEKLEIVKIKQNIFEEWSEDPSHIEFDHTRVGDARRNPEQLERDYETHDKKANSMIRIVDSAKEMLKNDLKGFKKSFKTILKEVRREKLNVSEPNTRKLEKLQFEIKRRLDRAKRFFEEAGLASEKGMVVIQNHDSLNNTKLKVNYLNNENFISLKNKIEELNKLFNEITPYVDPNQ